MNASSAVDVFDTLHELLGLYRTRLRQRMEAVHSELTVNEMRILMRTGNRPGITQKDLVEHSRTDKAQMARMLAQLQDKGWLERSASASDKRVRCLQLSEQGRQLHARLRALQEQVAAELLADCPEAVQAQLLLLLGQARDSARAHGGDAAAAGQVRSD